MDWHRRLLDHGQSYWLDNLTREMLRDGSLARRVSDQGLRGVTSNPAIFQKAISSGADYDDDIARLARSGLTAFQIYDRLTTDDVRAACDVLRPVFDESGGGDGHVSLEVSPYLAHDTEGTLREARRLWASVDRPNLQIKIPGTPAGVPAIEQALFEGINVNVTLLFSVSAYEAVAEAHTRALERRLEAGHPVDQVTSVASFFLSRIDVLADALLAQRVGTPDGAAAATLMGRTAVANAKLAYGRFLERIRGPRWKPLLEAGASVQRMLWASTSTKNPLYSDVLYVEPLIGPHTVNTLPEATISAFADHGRVATTIEGGLEEARRLPELLSAVGVDLDRVTAQLLDEGVTKFSGPFDRLMSLLERRRRDAGGGPALARTGAGPIDSTWSGLLDSLQERQAARRLMAGDASLWSSDPGTPELADRLGWLRAASEYLDRVPELEALADALRSEGIRHVVVLGMGGSSLAPEVARSCLPRSAEYPSLVVLDSTVPGAVQRVLDEIDPGSAVFVVASKSGTTTETDAFHRFFASRAEAALGRDPRDRFIAVTDPDTPLAREAGERGFRAAFLNRPDIGGRYSALSFFGLVPMALSGIDVSAVLRSAIAAQVGMDGEIPAPDHPGVRLGALWAAAALEGRDKLTILTSPSLAAFGLWAEQLIAESTGKEGRGLVPIVGESLEDAAVGDDRLYVILESGSDEPAPFDSFVEERSGAGDPWVRIAVPDPHDLGAEFLRWEVATAAAGIVLGVNPFDQPNVAESKTNTKALLERWTTNGGPEPVAPGLTLGSQLSKLGEASLPTILADRTRPGDVVSILAYLAGSPEELRALETLRSAVVDAAGRPATVGLGPRYLHSTGQLHKGGPDDGIFVILRSEPGGEDLEIPGEPYSFGVLQRAQAEGDFQALDRRGRRVAMITLPASSDPARLADLVLGAPAVDPGRA